MIYRNLCENTAPGENVEVVLTLASLLGDVRLLPPGDDWHPAMTKTKNLYAGFEEGTLTTHITNEVIYFLVEALRKVLLAKPILLRKGKQQWRADQMILGGELWMSFDPIKQKISGLKPSFRFFHPNEHNFFSDWKSEIRMFFNNAPSQNRMMLCWYINFNRGREVSPR